MTKANYKYEEADRYIVVNNGDPDLRKIILSLPKAPPEHLIDGYGLAPSEQKFSRLVIPRRLVDLEAEAVDITKKELSSNKNNVVTLLKIQKTFWRLLEERHKDYKTEINFIRKVWWHRVYGYWFYSNGKPTYIAPWHFYYLNFWTMDTSDGANRPSYRERDRKEFLFYHYAYTSNETFAHLDKDGYAIKGKDGKYEMKELVDNENKPLRVCYGVVQSKNRRSGNTNKSLNVGLEMLTRSTLIDAGIQSYSNDNAEDHHQTKLMPAYEKIPIFLKPNTRSGRTSMDLDFNVGKNEYGEPALQAKYTYATTSSEKFYDGKKLIFLLLDEQGKTTSCSILKRWDVSKNCLSQGNGRILHGFCLSPSTVDEVEASESAFDYRFLCSNSNFYRRIPATGQTYSGMFRLFVPATEGLDGFIDSFGDSVKDTISDTQRKEGFKQTALDFLQGKRDALLSDGSPEAMRAYREEKKLFPLFYGDSFLGESGSIGFNMETIDTRIAELRRKKDVLVGNLEWVDGEYEGDVVFVEDSENGRWEVSHMPSDYTSNKKTRVMAYNYLEGKYTETWRPINMKAGVVGADPIKNIRKKESVRGSKGDRLSDGGIAAYINFDESVDGKIPRSQRQTDKFCLSYRYRHSNTDDYNEDVLKTIIWTGFPIYVETNIDSLVTFLIKAGYSGYLIHDIEYNGQIRLKPGVDTSGQSKQRLFSLLRDYVEFRGHQEQHEAFLYECKNIRSMEEMRYYDRLTSHGLCLMGAESPYLDKLGVRDNENNNYDLSNFYG